MFYVNVMNFCKGNINAYINFDTIYLAKFTLSSLPGKFKCSALE